MIYHSGHYLFFPYTYPLEERITRMNVSEVKIDEAILALLYLNFHSDEDTVRAWKSFDWGAMDRLHQKGFISDPKSKAKSVLVTEEGQKAAKELFEKFFSS